MSGPSANGGAGRWIAIAASVVMVASISASIWITGSPSAQRDARLDERRVRDMDQITDAIHAHWQEKAALPTSLAELASKPGTRLAVVDPVSGTPYEYSATGSHAYRLCARFTTDTALLPPDHYLAQEIRWAHGSGRQCFDRISTTSSGLISD